MHTSYALFFTGYPAKLSYSGFGQLTVQPLSRPTFLVDDDIRLVGNPRYFYVDYSRERILENGEPKDDPAANSISGSILWKMNWFEDYSTWTPEDAEVVGLIARSDDGLAVLAAVRIEQINAFTIQAPLVLATNYLSRDASGTIPDLR